MKNIGRKYKIRRNRTKISEIMKQKMQANAQRLRRFKESKFYRKNKIFKEDTKKLYCELGKKSIEVNEPPEIQEVENL